MDESDGEPTFDDGVYCVQHELGKGRSLSTTVVMAVADVAGVDPADIPEQLYDVVDPEALDRLFEPKETGAPRKGGRLSFSLYGHHVTVRGNGVVTVQSGLARIKRNGGNLLVVGSVPDSVLDTASSLLLGETAVGRTRVFALHDRDVATARRRLSLARSSGENARVVDYHTGARSATASAPEEVGPTVDRVTGDLDALRDAVVDTVERLDDERRFDPAELRVCFDSLRPVVENHDEAAVEAFLGPICEAVEAASGMGHYVLPVAYDSPAVQSVAGTFDAVVELRTGDAGPEQRWHLRETDHTTGWFDL